MEVLEVQNVLQEKVQRETSHQQGQRCIQQEVHNLLWGLVGTSKHFDVKVVDEFRTCNACHETLLRYRTKRGKLSHSRLCRGMLGTRKRFVERDLNATANILSVGTSSIRPPHLRRSKEDLQEGTIPPPQKQRCTGTTESKVEERRKVAKNRGSISVDPTSSNPSLMETYEAMMDLSIKG